MKRKFYEVKKQKYIDILEKTLKEKFNDNETIERVQSKHSFETVFFKFYKTFKKMFDLETIYDLTVKLCHHYMMEIEHVYLINPITKYIIRMMNISIYIAPNQNICLEYVMTNDILTYLEQKKIDFSMDIEFMSLLDGEKLNQLLVEGYLSNLFKFPK